MAPHPRKMNCTTAWKRNVKLSDETIFERAHGFTNHYRNIKSCLSDVIRTICMRSIAEDEPKKSNSSIVICNGWIVECKKRSRPRVDIFNWLCSNHVRNPILHTQKLDRSQSLILYFLWSTRNSFYTSWSCWLNSELLQRTLKRKEKSFTMAGSAMEHIS